MIYGELNLGQIEAVINKLGGMDGVMQFLADKSVTPPLLGFITVVKVPAVKQFVASDYFKHGEVVDGVMCYLLDNFQKQFGQRVDENVDECDIRIHKLLRNSRDLGIRAEITEEREETKLAHLWHLLTLQPNGENGTLLTNGSANIFRIRDTEGTLWVVDAFWRSGRRGWRLGASSVGSLREWCNGNLVYSR